MGTLGVGTFRLGGALALAAACVVLSGCGDDDAAAVCGNGAIEAGETCDDGNQVAGDGCDAQCQQEGCGDHCECSALSDVGDLIATNELFFGYSALGADISIPDCGEREDGREVYLSFTPDFDGDLVVSTVHPTTQLGTVIEVRQGSCDGSDLECVASTAEAPFGARLTLAVQAGAPYVAMVETDDDESGVFALSLHRPGVCEGLGVTGDITADLLSGARFPVDTRSSTASMRGTCSAAEDGNPEALLSFTAPQSGVVVATTAHPDTDFDPLLYVREGRAGGDALCDSLEAERACENDGPGGSVDPWLRFEVVAGRPYSLFVDGGSADGRGQATVTLGYEVAGPADGTLNGCDHDTLADEFAFWVEAGQAVYVNADTVDAATAADLRMRVKNPDGSELHEADDDVACTFPPPQYSCPEYAYTATAAGLYSVEVYVGTSERCYDPTRINYKLTVTLDDQPATLIQVRDQ